MSGTLRSLSIESDDRSGELINYDFPPRSVKHHVKLRAVPDRGGRLMSLIATRRAVSGLKLKLGCSC